MSLPKSLYIPLQLRSSDMTNATQRNTDLEERLADIQRHLKDIRQDVSSILHAVLDELHAYREREFWRDYGDTYHQE